MEIGRAFVTVRPDTGQFASELTGDVESAGRTAAQKLRDVFSAALFARGLKGAIDAASQLEQAVGGTQAVFGAASDTIDDFASRSAEALGLSERSFREFTSQIGGQLKAFGFDAQAAADGAIELTQLGADLAATYGGPVSEAVSAVSAALRGEFDPLERYGTALRATDIAARAVALGLAESTGEVSNNARAQATLSLLLEQTASAQGQFARESDTAAGAQAIAAARAEDAAASLGENFLPIYERITTVVGALAEAFGSLPGPVQTAVVALAGVAALSGPVRTLAELGRSILPLVASGFDRAAIGAYNFAGALSIGAVTGVGAVLTALAGAYIGVKMRSDEAARKAEEYAQALDQQGEAADRAVAALIAENIAGVIERQDELGISTQLATDAITGQADAIEQLNAMREEAQEILGRNPADREAQDRLAAIDAIFRETTAYQANTNASQENADAQEEVEGALAGTGEQAGITADEIDALSDAFQRFIDETFGVNEAQRELAAAFDEAFATLVENGPTAFDDFTEAGRENSAALQEVVEATLAVVEAQLAIDPSGQTASATLDAVSARLVEARDRGLITQDTFEELSSAIQSVPDVAETAVETPGLDVARQKLGSYELQIGRVTGIFSGLFGANTQPATTALDALENRIGEVTRDRIINISASINAFASGTRSAPAGVALVGEEGPELVQFGGGERVYTTAETEAMASQLAAAGGSASPVQAIDEDRLASKIATALARALAVDSRALYLAISGAGRPYERGQRQATERTL